MPTISACLIARDEEEALPVCLGSIKGHVDEILVVDTGSSDRTIEIARSFGATVLLCNPETHPDFFLMDDETSRGPGPYTRKPILAHFGEARNVGWDAAQSDYLVWFDCDDLVVGAEKLRGITEQMERDNVSLGALRYIYGRTEDGRTTTDQWRERIAKRGTWRWSGAIHEVVGVADRRYDGVVVEHKRKHKPSGVAHRNYKVLRRVLEREGVTPRTLFYLGNEARWLNASEASGYYERYLRISGWPEERFLARVELGRIWERWGDYEVSFRHYAAASMEEPDNPDAWFGLARATYYMERWQECVWYSEEGFKRGNPDSAIWHNPLERLGEPHVFYNVALFKTNRVEDAIGSCQQGLKWLPDQQHLQSNLAFYTEFLADRAKAVTP